MSTIYDLIKRLVRENGREYAPQYGLAIVCMMLVAGTTSLSAYVLKYVVDTIFVHQDRAALLGITVGIVIIFVAKGFSAYFSEVILGHIGNRLVAQTQKRMFDHMLRVDVAFFQKNSSSDLVTRMSHNASAVRDMLNMVSLNLGRDFFTIIGLVITMVALDPVLSAIAFVGGPIAVLTSRKMVERIKKVMRGEAQSMSGIILITREVSQGAQVVKSFQLEPKMRTRMFYAIEAVQQRANKTLSIQAGVNPLMDTIGGCAVAAIALYAGWRNLYHGENPGQFFAFITALLMCADPARRLSRVQLQLASAAVGVRMMYELIDTPAREEELVGLPDLVVKSGGISLRDIAFQYVANKPVIEGITLSIPPGKVTALVGHSGGGKTTIFALLQRLRIPDAGVIEIDGQSIADVSLNSLRRNISVVGQDAFLFEGSIIDNIRAGHENALEETCIEAAKAASAHEFIMALPYGYNTQVGELGGHVSGGQRQRIALARAFLKKAPIILLDEPTSSLDSETEGVIQRGLHRLTEGKTTLVIAHRLSTILHADLIHVIEAGRVIESGTHEQLVAFGGVYNRMYKLQFAKFLKTKQSLAEAI